MSDSRKICIFFHSSAAVVGLGFLIFEVSRAHSDTYTLKDSSSRVIGLSQRPLPSNKQQSQQTIFTHPARFEPAIAAN